MMALVTWDSFDKLGMVLGVVTGFITVFIWFYLIMRDNKYNKLIAINLFVPETGFKATLPGKIRRKNLTRAELQGLLGMLPMKVAKDRYVLGVLNTSDFFEVLEQAQVCREVDEINIICEEHEIAQFDSERLKEVCKVTMKNTDKT